MKRIFIRALKSKQKMIIMYMDENEQITKRTVKILRINKTNMLVYCYMRKKLRLFHYSHILSAMPTNKYIIA